MAEEAEEIPSRQASPVKRGRGAGRGAATKKAPKAATKAVKPKGKGKPKSNSSTPPMDWQSFLKPSEPSEEVKDEEEDEENMYEAADMEAEDAASMIMEAAPLGRKKKRGDKKELDIGIDEKGYALPDDDSSPYTAAQMYVAKKHAAKNSEFAADLQKAKASGKLDYRKFVNGKIAKTCSFANIMVPCLVASTVTQGIELEQTKGATSRSLGKSLTSWEVSWGHVRQDLVYLSFQKLVY